MQDEHELPVHFLFLQWIVQVHFLVHFLISWFPQTAKRQEADYLWHHSRLEQIQANLVRQVIFVPGGSPLWEL